MPGPPPGAAIGVQTGPGVGFGTGFGAGALHSPRKKAHCSQLVPSAKTHWSPFSVYPSFVQWTAAGFARPISDDCEPLDGAGSDCAVQPATIERSEAKPTKRTV